MRIDAHQHFWQYQSKDYPWITEDMPALKKDCLPKDLLPLLEQYAIDGCIAVQARANIAENQFLVSLAEQYPWILGIVGWLDLCATDVSEKLAQYNENKMIKGYRHLVQDEANPSLFLENKAFNQGVAAVLQQNKVYEVLIHSKDLMAASHFCARHDNHILVLDHLGKPNITKESATEWAAHLKPLAKQAHVYCKLSGIITEAGNQWTEEQIFPFIEQALLLFGAERLMFGSDWPVCLLAGQYQQVYQLIEKAILKLSKDEQQAIWGGNACQVYQLAY